MLSRAFRVDWCDEKIKSMNTVPRTLGRCRSHFATRFSLCQAWFRRFSAQMWMPAGTSRMCDLSSWGDFRRQFQQGGLQQAGCAGVGGPWFLLNCELLICGDSVVADFSMFLKVALKSEPG